MTAISNQYSERLNIKQIQQAIDDYPVAPPHRNKFKPPRINNGRRWSYYESQLNSQDSSNENEIEIESQNNEPIASSETEVTEPRRVSVYSPPRIINHRKWSSSQLTAPPKPKNLKNARSETETIANDRPRRVSTYSRPRVTNHRKWRLSQCIYQQARSMRNKTNQNDVNQ